MQKCWEIQGCARGDCAVRKSGRSLWQWRDAENRCAAGSRQARQALQAHASEEAQLLMRAQRRDQEAVEQLILEYQGLVSAMAGRFFLPGADREDLHQEGLTGLLQAVQTFDPGNRMSFPDYAALCVRNALVRAVRAATRRKHQVLSKAETLEPQDLHALPDMAEDPARVVSARLLLKELDQTMRVALSSLEYKSLLARAQGCSVQEIGGRYSSTPKQVENALFRARQKMLQHNLPTHERRIAASADKTGGKAVQRRQGPADIRSGRTRLAQESCGG